MLGKGDKLAEYYLCSHAHTDTVSIAVHEQLAIINS